MTCKECRPLAIDLARGLPPFDIGGAVQRGNVLSHIARCKGCAEWLAEQEALSEALRAAAEADASLSAPPSVEANVMAAWRARQAQLQSVERPAVGSDSPLESPVSLARSESVARGWKPAWPAWPASGFAAAAAVVILTLALTLSRWVNAPPAERATEQVASAAASPVAAQPGERTVERRGTRAGERTGERTGEPTRGPTGEPTRTPVTGTHAAVVEVLPEKPTKGRPVRPRVTAQRAAAARAANEFSGPAFVLLPYVEPLRPTEMRHIMRVRMSRAQLVAGEAQAGGVDGATVLADVLVGEDGTARAVRIVQ